jgi:hypothetical protein
VEKTRQARHKKEAPFTFFREKCQIASQKPALTISLYPFCMDEDLGLNERGFDGLSKQCRLKKLTALLTKNLRIFFDFKVEFKSFLS